MKLHSKTIIRPNDDKYRASSTVAVLLRVPQVVLDKIGRRLSIHVKIGIMRVGQTTAIHFIAKLAASLSGFLATIYFARILGAEVLGIYFLASGVVTWLVLGSKMGFNTAISKRISEKGEKDPYISAGAILSISLYLIIAVAIYLAREPLDSYFGASIYQFVLLMLGVTVLDGLTNAVLRGEHLVHLKGIQNFLGTFLRSIFQILLVYLGFELVGMLTGYIIAYFAVAVLGGLMVLRYADRRISIAVPQRRHFRSLFDYAKYSWAGRLEARAFGWTDIIVLGVFVPSNLVGVYGVCWTMASFMSIFGDSISQTMFPEVSEVSSEGDKRKIAQYLNDSIAYTGLLVIPGLVGAALVGRGVLNIYGREFSQGYLILTILVAAVLLYSYQKQFLNILNAVDRPDLSFRVNTIFVAVNLLLNVLLIYLYGWIGAAVATLISSSLGLVLAYKKVSEILDISLPTGRITYQVTSSFLMAIVVFILLTIARSEGYIMEEMFVTLSIVSVGVIVYFSSMLYMSQDFRQIVRDNTPI